MFRGEVGRAGVFALVLASLVPLLVAQSHLRPISISHSFLSATADGSGMVPERVRDVARGEVVLGVEAAPAAAVEPIATPEPTPEPTPAPTPAPEVATDPALPDPLTGGIVIASWYGPGFYGNRTACGQVYTPEIIGVAHRTLRCGTMLVLEYRGRTITVPVIDRGPYIVGRTLDLSNAARLALGCSDLCTLSMRIAQ